MNSIYREKSVSYESLIEFNENEQYYPCKCESHFMRTSGVNVLDANISDVSLGNRLITNVKTAATVLAKFISFPFVYIYNFITNIVHCLIDKQQKCDLIDIEMQLYSLKNSQEDNQPLYDDSTSFIFSIEDSKVICSVNNPVYLDNELDNESISVFNLEVYHE